ncbi:transposase family protein [Streptomyces sp. NPDC056190]|uniref:transposase family protein n=1 Tax=Streptomyces sp. NPDC056190 TaxID=3345741 RepID=UPI0035D7A94A
MPSGLLDALARVPDPRNPRGVRFRLATLLAVGVCAVTSAGRNSLTAFAEWVRRCDQDVLARLGCPFDPFTGQFRAPGERTLRDVFARVDPAVLTAAGFARLAALQPRPVSPAGPDGTVEREQRRAHRIALREDRPRPRRAAFAEDASQIRRHRTPAVVSDLRDLARATLHRSGWANIASGRRAHTHPAAALTLHGIP